MVDPGVGEQGGGAPLGKNGTFASVKTGSGMGMVLCLILSRNPGFVDSGVCHCVFCSDDVHCGSHLFVIAAGSKLDTVHLTAHQNLELLNYLNVVTASKAIRSDQLEELLTVHPIFPAIKISCTNCLR